MFIIKYRNIWFALSGVFIAGSIWVIFAYGFNLSIDFKGGTITEVKYAEVRPEKTILEESIVQLGLGGFSVRPSEDDGYVIRTRELSDAEKQELLIALGHPNIALSIERQNSIGPVAGAELQSKAVKAIFVVIIMILLFITIAFRKVSKPVSSWKYALATIIALVHDVLIPTGVFVYLGYVFGYEIDLLFVTGLLAVLGYSVHDTIVVFDRVRENLRINQDLPAGRQGRIGEEFELTVGRAVNQTLVRSVNTSLTLLITLLALYIFGSIATQGLTLLLIIGLVAGTYSSIFLASPLLVMFYKWQKVA